MEITINETGIESKIFLETFLCLGIAGVWKFTTMNRQWFQLCYPIFTFFAYTSVFMLIVVTVVEIIISEEKNITNFIEYWYMIAVFTTVLMKSANVIINRKKIIYILKTTMLDERWTNLRDDEEIAIMKNSEKGELMILKVWMGFLLVNAIANGLNPIISDNPESNLMWECWSPCDRHVSSCFWLCYVYQVFGYIISSTTGGACDCIIFNFIERLCAYFRILQHRLKILPNLVRTGAICTAKDERHYLNDCILDHQNIYKAATEVSRIFNATVFVHFFLSFSVLGTNIYFLSKQPLFSSYFIAVFAYLSCLMVQNLFYCWYGYKFTEISREIPYTIFAMDWINLQKETREALRLVMLSASKHISLFDNFIVELSPEMFLKMMKISYSAFNLLKMQN